MNVHGPGRRHGLCLLALLLVAPRPAAGALAGRFESLGIPVRVGGLMGCVVGPNGGGGEALYFNFGFNGELWRCRLAEPARLSR